MTIYIRGTKDSLALILSDNGISGEKALEADLPKEMAPINDTVKIEKPEFAKADEFKLNTKMIKNKEVVDFIKRNPDNEDLFKMLLSGFRKIRVRNTNVIDDKLKTSINRLVNNIRTLITTTNEVFLSFKEWKASK